ncbi:MAG: hypothetical protein LCI00_13815 [Chloroflexi bacterium]|nr:hypothetical protein [Chloroflexota bacterium]MCC6892259.1 hypothetical protein [Anaerolineae bacterium]
MDNMNTFGYANYVFIAKPELVQFIGDDVVAAYILCKPVIWSYPYGGVKILIPDDEVKLLKLLFLSDIQVRSRKYNGLLATLDKVLGTQLPYTPDLFDKWWILTKAGDSKSWDTLTDSLNTETMSLLLPAEPSAVDKQIRRLVDIALRKKSQSK